MEWHNTVQSKCEAVVGQGGGEGEEGTSSVRPWKRENVSAMGSVCLGVQVCACACVYEYAFACVSICVFVHLLLAGKGTHTQAHTMLTLMWIHAGICS